MAISQKNENHLNYQHDLNKDEKSLLFWERKVCLSTMSSIRIRTERPVGSGDF